MLVEMNKNKGKKQHKKSPGIDLKTATKEEIILFVRDTLKPIEIRKILYPGFLNATKDIQDKEELAQLVKETFLKARALEQKEKLEEKKVSISAEKEEATENNSNKKKKKLTNNSPMEEKINSSLSGDSGKNSFHSTRERESFHSTSSSVSKSIRIKNYTNPLSVWEKIQYYLQNPTELEDLAVLRRLELYSKRALFIIHVIDVYQVLTVYEAHRKAQEVIGLKMSSRKTVGDFLKDLYFDNFLDLEVLPRKNNIEPKLYSVKGFQEKYPAKYERARNRHATRIEIYTYNNSYEQNNIRIDLDKDKLESIKNTAKLTSLAQKEGYAEARKEEREREDKERIEKQKEVVKESLQVSKDPSPGDSFNVLLYNSVQELSKEELERSKKSKPFREAYNKMLKQKEGMTKEELESILNLEELRQKRDRDRST